MYDIIIIGAGVTGAAVARELSRYQAKICVLERAEDVCCGTSKANSGIVHAGYDAKPGTMKAKMNLLGNALMGPLSEELDFPFIRKGSLVVCTREEELPKLQKLYEKGITNGVPGMKILTREEALLMEPNLTEEVCAALYAPTGGIVCPFSLNIALAENAYKNGVEFFFDTEVTGIKKGTDRGKEGYTIETDQGNYQTRCVVNAAGVYADVLHNMVSEKKLSITPRKGEYCLLDKSAGAHVSRTIFSLPGKYGKGVLVTPTAHGNLLVGPTSVDIQDKEGIHTTRKGIEDLTEKAGKSVRNLPMREVITSFAGLRAHEAEGDFILEEAVDAPGFFDCAGIESPGLTSAPAIGKYMAQLIKEKMKLKENSKFDGRRRGILNPKLLSMEERNELIREEPAYGTIICRCEMITEGEILDAIHRPLGARSLDGVKRRTRAGMGRCQSGFCMPRTMEILARELQKEQKELTKSGGNSRIILGQEEQEVAGR
ncbi:MAG: NAD(P)/FAD-dependent oxidoreductase [Dorea sp.]|nr:NAD(P)/FAD-dependent oxidoreductase [Dorea sp.]